MIFPRLECRKLILGLALWMAGWLSVASSPAADEPPSLERIRSMTRDQREVLLHSLGRFDELSRDEKAAVRELDSRLEGLEPEVRARYLAVMRHYHTLYNSLPKDRRQLLDKETNPNEKLKLLVRFQQDMAKAESEEDAKYREALQVSLLAPRRLLLTARELIVWFSLDEPEDAKDKAEFARMNTQEKRGKFMAEYLKNQSQGKKKKIGQQLRQEYDVFLTDEEWLVVNREVRMHEAKIRENAEAKLKADPSKKGEGAKKKIDSKDQEKAHGEAIKGATKRFIQNWVDQHSKQLEPDVFRKFANAKMDVAPADLARFMAALPPWAWESVDSLPPDAAQRRLKVLYRLVFPTGTEMPIPKAPAKAKIEPAKPKPSANGDPSKPF